MAIRMKSSNESYLVIGLMSGTSMDGVDAALIKSNGVDYVESGLGITVPYSKAFRASLTKVIASGEYDQALEKELTEYHVKAVFSLLEQAKLSKEAIDLIGFHGHTVLHRPEEGLTKQIGNASYLSQKTGIHVVYDFRSQDVLAGGQGAPLVPVYHKALMHHHVPSFPVAIVNIGGVANVTYIDQDTLIAFDTGPGNAMIDDKVLHALGQPYDVSGDIAARGAIHQDVLNQYLQHPFFKQPPPKSMDRNHFHTIRPLKSMSIEDEISTLTALTATSIAMSASFFPKSPRFWYVTGGGRKNDTILYMLQQQLDF